jgi:hypothetical protein
MMARGAGTCGWRASAGSRPCSEGHTISLILFATSTEIYSLHLLSTRRPAGSDFLLFSGQASTADLLERARAEGYDFDLLSKPVHPADLLAKLRI